MSEFYVATRYEGGTVGIEDTGFFESAEDAQAYMDVDMIHCGDSEELIIQVVSSRKVAQIFTFEEVK